ncbi:MAG: acyl carrier protein [Planctomycetaceae bacterium]
MNNSISPRTKSPRQLRFREDLKADSLDLGRIIAEFEEEFGITIPDDDYEKIRTVGDAVKYIQEKTRSMRRRVVVTGCGVVTALGLELSEFWDRL